MKSIIKNSKGVSTAEAMLSITCFALVAYFIIDTITKQNEQIINASAEIEVVSLLNEIRVVLSDPLSCSATFDDLDPSDTYNAVPYLLRIPLNSNDQYAEGTPVLGTFKATNKGYGPNNRVKILNYSLDASDPKVGLRQDSTHLTIRFDKGLSDSRRSRVYRRIKLFIQTKKNKNGQIVIDQCSLNDHRQNKKIWSKSEKPASDGIFYPKGFVGIGTNFPTSPLTVNGSIRLGYTESPCTPDLKGSLRYNRILQNIEICHGNGAWRLVGEAQ